MDTVREYTTENLNFKYSNLNSAEKDGLKKIIQSINDKKISCI